MLENARPHPGQTTGDTNGACRSVCSLPLNPEPKSDEWLLEHLRTIGASNAAVPLGQHRFRTGFKLHRMMRAAIVENRVPQRIDDSDDIRRGVIFEPLAREMLSQHLGVPVREHDQNAFIYDVRFPYAHSLPDAWVQRSQPCELKCPRPGTIARCNLNGLIAEWYAGCQHTLKITDAPRMFIGLLNVVNVRMSVYEVWADEPFQDMLLESEAAFYNSVITNTPPENSNLCPEEQGSSDSVVLTDDESATLARTYNQLHSLIEDATDSLEDVKLRLCGAANDADRFEVPNILRVIHTKRDGARKFLKDKAVEDFPALNDKKYWGRNAASRPFIGRNLETE